MMNIVSKFSKSKNRKILSEFEQIRSIFIFILKVSFIFPISFLENLEELEKLIKQLICYWTSQINLKYNCLEAVT